MILTAALISGAVASIWYCGVLLFLYKGYRALPGAREAANHRFSVVIAARNEAANIGPCLQSVLCQSITSDRFEVIVVNDRSTDATAEIVERFERIHKNLSHLTIETTPRGVAPKKWAIAQGVERAGNEIIVFTDADCRVPSTWLDTIDRHFEPSVGAVQGVTCYRYTSGMNRLFFKLQSLDFLSHGIVAAAAIGAHLPINSNANNLAIRRSAYDAAGGLAGGPIGGVVSGDDDLLLQRIWKSGKWDISYMSDMRGAVETLPTPTIRALFHQRARWGSKTVHYQPRQVILLAGIFFFYSFIAATFFLDFINPAVLPLTISMLIIKFAGECLLMVPGLSRLGKRELLAVMPLASLLQLPLVLAATIMGVFGRFTWKDQSFSRTIRKQMKGPEK